MGAERDQLILEWMRSNEAFKSLARRHPKGAVGRPEPRASGREGADPGAGEASPEALAPRAPGPR